MNYLVILRMLYAARETMRFLKSQHMSCWAAVKMFIPVNGIAAMHSQKISNALRTIDTWYPDYEDGIGPIAIETYGSVTALGRAYRTPKDKKDFYTLFDAWSTGNELSCEEDEHYVMAVLVRGGVFGQSGKDDE